MHQKRMKKNGTKTFVVTTLVWLIIYIEKKAQIPTHNRKLAPLNLIYAYYEKQGFKKGCGAKPSMNKWKSSRATRDLEILVGRKNVESWNGEMKNHRNLMSNYLLSCVTTICAASRRGRKEGRNRGAKLWEYEPKACAGLGPKFFGKLFLKWRT